MKVGFEIRDSSAENQMQSMCVADSRKLLVWFGPLVSSKFLIPYEDLEFLAVIGPVNLDYRASGQSG